MLLKVNPLDSYRVPLFSQNFKDMVRDTLSKYSRQIRLCLFIFDHFRSQKLLIMRTKPLGSLTVRRS